MVIGGGISILPENFLEEIKVNVKEVGKIDTCYGGIGYHGHIAFNEPPINR